MAKNRLYRILSRISEIKPGEELIGILLFFYFFLVAGPYTLIKSLRNAKLLNRMGIDAVPVAYLVTAIIIGFIVAFHSRIQVKLSRQVLITGSLVFFILTCAFFMLPFPETWSWIAIVYWVWANIYIVVLTTQFWIIVNDVFNPREAKRLIGFFGSGVSARQNCSKRQGSGA